MGGRAVEGTGLENRRGRKLTVGSNPTPSANINDLADRELTSVRLSFAFFGTIWHTYWRRLAEAPNMASIQQRGEFQWRVQIRRLGPDGKSITKSRTFETYSAAKRWTNVT
jgi:hypothetical protein